MRSLSFPSPVNHTWSTALLCIGKFITNTFTDPNPWNACILCTHLLVAQCAHTGLYPRPLHRLRPRRRLGNLHALHLPPRQVKRPLRFLHRSLLRRGVHRRCLRAALHLAR